MEVPQFLRSLWGKIEEKIKKQGDAESQPAKDPDVPSTDLPSYRHRAVHHHPNAHDIQHRTAEREYWQDQLRLSKALNCITKTLNAITIVATVFAGVAALAGFASIFFLWWTLNETIHYNRMDQRPWVFVVEVSARLETNQLTEFPVDVVNNGHTPAYIFETSHSCTVAPLPDVPKYAPRPNSMILPPGPSFTANSGFEVGPPENVLAEVRDGKKPLHCYGYYRYRDWLGEEHQTGYALKFNRKTLGFDFFTNPAYVYAN